jgi:acyl-CoA thioester hydrolase
VTPPPSAFSTLQRVRFGDLDAMQHMNNVEFLRFFETARIDYMIQLSPEHAPTERRQFGFIFAECHISYRAPAFFGDMIRTYIWPSELKRSSLRLAFEMRDEGDDRLVADGWGTLVGYDYGAGKPQPIPDVLRQRVEPTLEPASDAVG